MFILFYTFMLYQYMCIMLNIYINFHCAFTCFVQHLRILLYKYGALQGFMQDPVIASHTCFDGHMDVKC